MTTEAVLALLGNDERQPASAPREPSPRATTPAPCSDEIAVHDAAALREGNLSPEGIERLAHHLMQCESCRILVAAIVGDAQCVKWTGNHAGPRDRPAK